MSAQSILPFPEPPQANLISLSHVQPRFTLEDSHLSSTLNTNDQFINNLNNSRVQTQTLNSVIATSMAQTPQDVSSMGGSVGAKESQPIPKFQQPEVTPIVEIQEQEKLPVEVEGYLQKLDQAGEITLKEPITHDGEVLLANSDAQVVKEKVVLPMTQSAVQQGMTAKVSDSARWLAEWCVRLIKMMKDGVKYAEERNEM